MLFKLGQKEDRWPVHRRAGRATNPIPFSFCIGKKTREQVANSEVSRSVVKNQTKKMVLVTKPVGSADWTNDETCWSCHNGHIADRYFCFWHWCLDGKIKPC